MAKSRSLCALLLVIILCQAQFAKAAPVGAVESKGITFKKLSLDEGGEKPNLPVASMVSSNGGAGKLMRIPLNESPEDAIGDVMDGNEEISRIFVTLPTTTTTASTTTTELTPLSSMTAIEEEQQKDQVTSETAKDDKSEVNVKGSPSGAEKENDQEEVKETETIDPVKSDSSVTNSRMEAEEATSSARIVKVSTNALEPEITVLPGISIEDSEKKIDNQNIQNLVLQEEDQPASLDFSGGNGNRSRKSKGLTDNKSPQTRSAGEEGEKDNEPSNPEARLQPSSSNHNLLIQFTENDRMELLNSQNNALTSEDLSQVRSSNVGLISGISFSVLALFCSVSLVGAMLYRRRYINKPQTLSEPDSHSGYIDDSIIRVS